MVGRNKDEYNIVVLLSTHYEFAYKFMEALWAIPFKKASFSIRFVAYSPYDEEFPCIEDLKPDAIVVALPVASRDLEIVLSYKVPVVNMVSGKHPGIMSLAVDERSLAECVVGHAVAAGFQNLVYLGTIGMEGDLAVQFDECRAHSATAGVGFEVIMVSDHPAGMSLETWESNNPRLIDYIEALDERTLFFTQHDGRSISLIKASRKRLIDIPEKMGVLGRGNHLISKFHEPPISSLETPYVKLASWALTMIDQALKNGIQGDERVPSGAVVPRYSTVGRRWNNEVKMTQLAKVIETFKHNSLTVDDIVQMAKVSRSTLERKYREANGETPAEAIRRVQLERSAAMLQSLK